MKTPFLSLTLTACLIVLCHSLIAQNVGVGTTTPYAKLEIVDSARNRTRMIIKSKNYIDSSTLIFRNKTDTLTGTDMIISSNREDGLTFSSQSDLPANNSAHILHLTPQGNAGINNPSPQAILDITSSNSGILIPRMTTASRLAIPFPVEGLMVYDLTTQSIWTYGITPSTGWKEYQVVPPKTGFYVYRTTDYSCPGFCPLPFNGVLFDDGSNWNPTFNRYFAPVTGLYHFDATIMVNNGSSFYQFAFEKVVGGSGTTISSTVHRPTSLGFNVSTTLACNVYLNQGESVHLILSAGTSTEVVKAGQTQSWLSGYRIY